MRIARGIIASCILSIISAADQQEEMRCKARPGCHLAKCDPGLLSPSLNANEYPVTCVRTSVQGGDEYNELKRNMQVLQAAFEVLNDDKKRMKRRDAALSKELEALKTKLSKSHESNKALTKDIRSLTSKITALENENKKTASELNALRAKTNDLESRLAKPNTALQIITRRSCDGVKLESALARNDSGGVFKLDIPEVGIKNVFCDIADDGGNWTVFQRRMNGDVDFYRNWDDYIKGFGDLQGDHWMGLEALHRLTKGGNAEMKIKMITRKGIHWVAKYRSFHIGPGSGNYRLHASGYSGNATYDALEYSNNEPFSTKDADHDPSSANCAKVHEGGWWYDRCGNNLNGNFHKTDYKGIWWGGVSYLLRFSEMKFREKS